MSAEENKAVLRRLFEAENGRNFALLDELISPGFSEGRGTPFELRGVEGYRQFVEMLFKAFPDWHETIEEMVAEGDKVCVQLQATATHTGDWNFLGVTLPPTGRKVTYSVIEIWRFVDGKAVERKSVRDLLVFMTQLGLVEPTEKGKKLFPA